MCPEIRGVLTISLQGQSPGARNDAEDAAAQEMGSQRQHSACRCLPDAHQPRDEPCEKRLPLAEHIGCRARKRSQISTEIGAAAVSTVPGRESCEAYC